MTTLQFDQERSCWSADALLARCEGYAVESEQGMLGYVERVVMEHDGTEPLALLVRSDSEGLVTVRVDDVVELHPGGERLVVRVAGRR